MVFNHVSYTDGIALAAYFLPCGIAKASVADIPFFGTFTKVPRVPLLKQRQCIAAHRPVFLLISLSGDALHRSPVPMSPHAVFCRCAEPRHPCMPRAEDSC